MGAVVGAGKRIEFIRGYLTTVFADDLHAKRVDSLANGTLGVMAGASLAVSIIGQALAQARGLLTKHAIKQVDRLLSNQGIVVWDMFSPWVAEVVGRRKAIVVAMDWTDFDADGQTTLALNLVTDHGRATPLVWRGDLIPRLVIEAILVAVETGVAKSLIYTYMEEKWNANFTRFAYHTQKRGGFDQLEEASRMGLLPKVGSINLAAFRCHPRSRRGKKSG